MKVGIVVDGDAEAQALKFVTRRLKIQGVSIVNPIYADMQPKSTPAQVARSAKAKIDILLSACSVDALVILIDREDSGTCPAALSAKYEKGFEKLGYPGTTVVVKNRQFENWLIADPDAIRSCKKRFFATGRIARQVVPDLADSVYDPVGVLNEACRGGDYHKRRDAADIAKKQDIAVAARNSRSFRRFLRVLNHERYLTQSRHPHAVGR